MTDFAPNKYARCECVLVLMMKPERMPICTHFEDANEEECPDCCVVCRHEEACHLKGHEA